MQIQDIVMGQRYTNSLHPDTIYMGALTMCEKQRGMMIIQGRGAGYVYDRRDVLDEVFWNSFRPLREESIRETKESGVGSQPSLSPAPSNTRLLVSYVYPIWNNSNTLLHGDLTTLIPTVNGEITDEQIAEIRQLLAKKHNVAGYNVNLISISRLSA